jgi:hypothetical protein
MTATGKPRPLLFSAVSIEPLRAGRKRQSRRVIKARWPDLDKKSRVALRDTCPYGQPGDELYVREACVYVPRSLYAATPGVEWVQNPTDPDEVAVFRAGWTGPPPPKPWRSPLRIHRWATRISLRLLEVRIERISEISPWDIRDEGVRCPEHDSASGMCVSECPALRGEFIAGWNALNAKRGFPYGERGYVFVLGFELLAPPAGLHVVPGEPRSIGGAA